MASTSLVAAVDQHAAVEDGQQAALFVRDGHGRGDHHAVRTLPFATRPCRGGGDHLEASTLGQLLAFRQQTLAGVDQAALGGARTGQDPSDEGIVGQIIRRTLVMGSAQHVSVRIQHGQEIHAPGPMDCLQLLPHQAGILLRDGVFQIAIERGPLQQGSDQVDSLGIRGPGGIQVPADALLHFLQPHLAQVLQGHKRQQRIRHQNDRDRDGRQLEPDGHGNRPLSNESREVSPQRPANDAYFTSAEPKRGQLWTVSIKLQHF